LRIWTLNGSMICPRSPRSVGRDLDLVLSRVSGDFRGSTSLVRLAMRTSGSYLNETNAWLEHSRRKRPSVRAIQRTVAHFRVMRHGRLFARRTATRHLNGRRDLADRFAHRVRLTLCRTESARGFTIGSAHGVWLPFAVLIPFVQGSGRFRSFQTPRALCRRHHFPTVFVGRPRASGARLLAGHARRGHEMALVAFPGSGLCS
jgi:hypothetical protein